MRMIKTLFLLTALTLLLVLGGDAIAGQQGMTFGLIIAVVMNGVAYFFSDKIALRSSGAQPVTREQLPRLYEVMERLVAKARLPMPKRAMGCGPRQMHLPPAATHRTLRWRSLRD